MRKQGGSTLGKDHRQKGRGMLFEMDKENGPMMFSALPYTPHEMENAMHPYELPAIHYTVVRAAKAQMGVGGDDSWGARTHPEYLLDTNGKMKFSFAFKRPLKCHKITEHKVRKKASGDCPEAFFIS